MKILKAFLIFLTTFCLLTLSFYWFLILLEIEQNLAFGTALFMTGFVEMFIAIFLLVWLGY